MGWGRAIPPSGSAIIAGDYGGRTRYACRGKVAGAGTTWHSGSSDMRVYPFGFSCIFSYSTSLGPPISFGATGADVELLVLMASAAEVTAAAGLTVAVPASASPTPSPSFTPSPLAFTPWLPTWVPASTLARPPAALRSGIEGTTIIYVCKGVLTDNSLMPGKYEVGWGGCDIPLNEVEVYDSTYTVLLNSSWLHWALAVPYGRAPVSWVPPASGWTPVIGGVATSTGGVLLNRTVCRAYHPFVWSGPHAGYTDGVMLAAGYGSDPTQVACQFSYGGLVVHSSAFDVLFVGPSSLSAAEAEAAGANFTHALKPGASPSRTPSNSRTPSVTASITPTSATTPTSSPSPLPPTSVIWVQVNTGLVAASPTRYTAAASTNFFVCRAAGATLANDAQAGSYYGVNSLCAVASGGVANGMVRMQSARELR